MRTPDKLRSQLALQHSIPTATTDRYLGIYQGDAKDPTAVSPALVSPLDNTLLVDVIYTGIGVYPKFAFSLTQPLPLTDPTICASGAAALFAALDTLAARGVTTTSKGGKPVLIALSATGVNGKKRDVPWVLVPLYRWLLGPAHDDKRNMEKLMLADKGAHVSDVVIVRPSVLTDGVEKGVAAVRVGWEWGQDGEPGEEREREAGPQIGWTVSRRDVGGWVFRKVIVEGGWEGRCVCITY